MKKNMLFLVIMGLSSLNMTSAFAARDVYFQKVAETYVQEAPPAPLQEAPTAQPKGDYAWISGCWIWEGKWIWNPGHWEKKPAPNAVWEKCYWAHTPQGWYFVEGHWVY